MRNDKRAADELRMVKIEYGTQLNADGSVYIHMGDTHVLCGVSVEDKVPPFLRGSGQGWITAEYGMLPRSTGSRMGREAARGKQGGRTMEIQRLIGRSLRAAVDMKRLGENTITIDCDVIQADGGTRTASITGGYVALADAINYLLDKKVIDKNPLQNQIASISVGVYQGVPVADLDYAEDSSCETDMNIVMNDKGGFIELQGTAEGDAFTQDELDAMLKLGKDAIGQLLDKQMEALSQ